MFAIQFITTFMATFAMASASTSSGWTYASTSNSCAATAASPCGPTNWGKLSPTCSSGTNQSPIDINGATSQTVYPQPTYGTASCYQWVQGTNGYGFQVDFTSQNYTCTDVQFAVSSISYVLQKISFHVPSEHTIAGGAFSAEAQLLHTASTGESIVLVVLLSEESGVSSGVNNAFLNSFWASTDSTTLMSGNTYPISYHSGLNPYSHFIPADVGRFIYDGSSTTPSCTEGVKYYVFEEAVKITSSDFNNLKNIPVQTGNQLDGNGDSIRPTQALNGRTVIYVPSTAVSTTDDYSTWNANQNAVAGLVLAVIGIGLITVLCCVSIILYSLVVKSNKTIAELKKAAQPEIAV